jgi:hypothetical protein
MSKDSEHNLCQGTVNIYVKGVGNHEHGLSQGTVNSKSGNSERPPALSYAEFPPSSCRQHPTRLLQLSLGSHPQLQPCHPKTKLIGVAPTR